MKFEEKLIKLRKEKALSQEELAEKLNVTRQTISKWELGQTKPDAEKLVEIAKFFEVSTDELLNETDISKSTKSYKESSVEIKNRNISIRIFILGIIIALILCGIGFIKQNNAKKTNEERKQQAYEQSHAAVEQAKKRYEEIMKEYETIEPQIDSLKLEIKKLRNEQQKIHIEDFGFSDRYYAKGNEIDEKEAELSKLQSKYTSLQQEQFRLENNDYTGYYSLVEPNTYMIFYFVAAGVFGLLSLIALIYFLATRKR